MILIPKYPFEFNCILNEEFNEDEQIKNFASLLSDKDRFLVLLPILEKNLKLVEEKLGYKLKEKIEFFVVRAEKFKSFSEPITIEYSLLPEEMILFLLKEIIKVSIIDRFPDEVIRDVYVNRFVEHIITIGDWGNLKLLDNIVLLDKESERLYPDYLLKKIDFENKLMIDYVEELFLDEMNKRGIGN